MTKISPQANAETFADLGINQQLVDSLAEKQITTPFAIQQLAIPIALSGADLIGQARTGTGKTLAFGLPLLQRITLPTDEDFDESEQHGKPQALVIVPTRELAIQVSKEIESAAHHCQARFVTVYGGVSYDEQLTQLKKGVDVVVGTPGRLIDLVNQKALDLSKISVLVLDEADEMLDLGFLPDVEKLTSKTPSQKQTMLFSATMPGQILSLARSQMNQPVHVRAESGDAQATVPDTIQFVYQAHELDKPEMIGKLLQSNKMQKAMVFTRTKRAAQQLSDELEKRGFNARSIHGDLNQQQRERTLRKFRKGDTKVLVCTDVAARGIDVDEVTHVINYEVPDDPSQYVHRIGRTGRAGAQGVAVTLVDWQDVTRWNAINSALDLDFKNPPETYSTSENFLVDLDIPKQAKGSIAKPESAEKPAPRKPRAKRVRRRRRRTKNGKVVQEGDPKPKTKN